MDVPKPPPPPKKILIVDDDGYLLGTYAEKFKEEGFAVSTADDGQEAWDLIQGGYTPDVMFTGIVMPRMTGFDLIRKMQADPRLAPIPVAISSHQGREEDKATAKALAVDDFLIKGTVTLNEVVRRVRLILGVQTSYQISLKREAHDAEALISLLDKQQLTSLGFQDGALLLGLEPQKDREVFKLKLIKEHPEQ